jgi:hypothetical protein
MTASGKDPAFVQRSAGLLLELYDARREPALREARNWWVTKFHPTSAEDVLAAWVAPDSGPYRMVTTYWEMACSFVTNGAIDAAMFHAANTEYLVIYAKLEPHLQRLRELAGYPHYLRELEAVIEAMPDREARLGPVRRFLKRRAAEAGAS